ncbi:hypothetical protein ABPG75_007214 [Micractinium tetrahymenae]
MYPFDSKRGLLAVGLAVASGGGVIVGKLLEVLTDPKQQQLLQTLLVFWLIFVAKTTLAYMRKLDGAPAAPQRQQQGRKGAAAAAAAIDPSAVNDDCDTPEPAVRRRRTRRD